MEKYLTRTILISLLIIFCSFGIIRHDKPKRDYINLGKRKEFNCVGKVLKQNSSTGSCVLISPKFAISAAHNFVFSDYRLDTVAIQGGHFIANTPINSRIDTASKYYVEINNRKIRVKNIVVLPEILDSLSDPKYDIAMLELQDTVSSVNFPSLDFPFSELGVNAISCVYGEFATGVEMEEHNSEIKLAGENVIDSIGGTEYNKVATRLYSDFDSPLKSKTNKTGNSTPLNLEFFPGAGGDCGGGLLYLLNNKTYLLGICISGVNVNEIIETKCFYGQLAEFMRIKPFRSWIKRVSNA